ncbi:MAG: CBS domain-containing protein [Candidatus Marinimicrobia bacterium]|nr:CBS domain-containing protein [Candidatus Neomarinimicrobiota bacterium]
MRKPIAVKDFMVKNIITFRPDQNVFEVIDQLVDTCISGGAVLDEDQNLIGIISEKDCMHTIVKSSYYDGMGALVSDLMTVEVDTVDINESIHSTAQKFLDCHYRRFPVLENGKLVGQVSRRDILKAVQSVPH